MPKYFTNFCFKGYKANEFHCTHVYFGELEESIVPDIIEKIKTYFSDQTLKQQEWIFDKRAMFGAEGDIPVLILTSKKIELYKDLKEMLKFANDEFEFIPHVTTTLIKFKAEMNRYSLVKVENKIANEIFTIQAIENSAV
jgi:2'-5' RNA ligase